MAEYLVQSENLIAIADKIRVLKDISQSMSLDDMEAQLDIPKNDSNDLITSGATVTVPAGYYASQSVKSVNTATQATPSIEINTSGLITATATQTEGYISAGTKSVTKQLTVQAAQTITPSTSNQTIAANTYLTGVQTIAGDANLIADNIKEGISIFGVTGNCVSSSDVLNFEVVGGTTQPTNPKENTIWVNTSTAITSWYFSPTQPSTTTSGDVWIVTGTSGNTTFNALKENNITIYLLSVKQYVKSGWSGSWNDVTAKIYCDGAWKDNTIYLYNAGDENTSLTGGWISTGKYAVKDSYGTYGGTAPTIQKNSDNLVAVATGSNQQSGFVHTKNKIDLTKYKTLKMVGAIYSTQDVLFDGIQIRSELSTEYPYGGYVAKYNVSQIDKTVSGEFTIDLSGVNGSYYVCLCVGCYNKSDATSSYVAMQSMTLEV